MNEPSFAMLDVRTHGEPRWGTRTLGELEQEQQTRTPSANSVRVFVQMQFRDATASEQAELAQRAARTLRKLLADYDTLRQDPESGWFRYEPNGRLHPVGVEQLQQAVAAYAELAGNRAIPPEQRPALVEVTLKHDEADPDATIAQLQASIAALVRPATPKGEAATREFLAASDPTAADMRKEFLQRDWPDSQTVGSIIMGVDATSAASTAARARKTGKLFGVWAGRSHGGYVHPEFQFKWNGLDPHTPELLAALAEIPGLSAKDDLSGWARIFWLYQRRGSLSKRSLALQQSPLSSVEADPAPFLALSGEARTPAEVFPAHPEAVIALAHKDAAQIPHAMEGAIGG